MQKIVNNFIYQGIFQVTKILLPLITIPIVSAALGPTGIGIYNYTNSIVQYFVLIAGLGVGLYGNREIATVRDNKNDLVKKFWEIFGISFFISSISFITYIIIVSFSHYRYLFYLQSLILMGSIFDISWFFMGIEDFKKTSLASLFSQIISFFAILFFVKDSNDLWIYVLIQSLNIFLSQTVVWLFIKDKIYFMKIGFSDMIKHALPSLSYFIPRVAIVLYTNLNKTILGILDSNESVGYYTNTLILNGILVTLITTIDLVLLPKFSNLVAKGDFSSIILTIKKSIKIQLFFTFPIMFGIILISPKLVPWFFGEKFLILIKTIPIVSPLVVIIPLGMAIGRQYLVPMNKIKVYNLAVIMGAIVSIILNLVLIPLIGLYGAIFATIIAESFVAFTRFYSFIKETKIKLPMISFIKYICSSALMFIIVNTLTKQFSPSFITTLIQIFSGFVIYMLLTLLLKCNPIYELIGVYINSKRGRHNQ